LRPLWGT